MAWSDTLGKPINVGLSDSPVSARNGRFTQVLTAAEAVRRGPALEREGIAWLEEPIRHDDYRGNAEIASRLEVPLQIGENFNGPLRPEPDRAKGDPGHRFFQ